MQGGWCSKPVDLNIKNSIANGAENISDHTS